MTEVTASGHLSIGEVLSLVQEDFPDVTISKIRFLESQGLIAPERTASGYRKFYDADIDRLRWILRQQRDHFLPLKVIRKMLDQGVDTVDSPGAQPTLWSSPEEDDAPTVDDADDVQEGDDAPQRSASHPAVSSSAAGRSAAPPSNPLASPRPGAPAPGDAAPERSSSERTSAERTTPERSTPPGRPAEQPAAEQPSSPTAEQPAADDPSVRDEPRPAHSTPADVVAALQEDPRRARAARRQTRAAPTQPEGPPTPDEEQPVTVERMSRTELCEASGISVELLAGLEDYGLIVPVVLGGNPAYDGEALAIARIASAYAALGVEPRHLRMYKVAAEREAGFIEQLVFPLLKQRNPDARRSAVERSDDLVRLGEELHSALLRRQLGPVLGT